MNFFRTTDTTDTTDTTIWKPGFMPKKGKTSSDDRQDKRPFLRDRATALSRGIITTA